MIKLKNLEIPAVILITPDIFEDSRGFFSEIYKFSEFKLNGISMEFKQDNHSRSNKGVLRGLHYQLEPYSQGKLVSVINGRIFDAAVDIRTGSPTFGKWVSEELSSENKKILWIPPGFAHGFLALEDNTDVMYKTTNEYNRESARGIIWNDPAVGIKWPIQNPSMSEKDIKNPKLKEAETNFKF